MGHGLLVAEHLTSGALVRPFSQGCSTGRHLLLQTASAHPKGSAAARVADLLRKDGQFGPT